MLNKDNNESKALDRALYSDLVGTSIGAIAGLQTLQLTLNPQQVLVQIYWFGQLCMLYSLPFLVSFSPVVIVPNAATAPILIIVVLRCSLP